MRIVLDTNILVAALITKGTPPDALYQYWIRDGFLLLTSTAQLEEVSSVLRRPRLSAIINSEEAAALIENIDTRATVLGHPPDVDLSPDPKDNPILAAAIAGSADLIVSGDKKHMLALRLVEGIPIVTARDALDRLGVR